MNTDAKYYEAGVIELERDIINDIRDAMISDLLSKTSDLSYVETSSSDDSEQDDSI